MNNEEEPETAQPLTIDLNIFKFNSYAAIAAVILSIFNKDIDYLNAVYDSLILIIIYTNLLFIYILYLNRHKL